MFDRDYYENGLATGKSLYQNFRWIPELTIPMAHHLAMYCGFQEEDLILDFGCAKGYVVKALRLLGYKAYGVDVSEYAISSAPKDIEEFIQLVTEQEALASFYDWIIVKDVLEHIPYAKIDQQLEIIKTAGNNIFVMVPLGDGKKYNIEAYELDPSHYIRETLNWWSRKLETSGFTVITASHDMGPFKNNWKSHNKGNGLLIGKSP